VAHDFNNILAALMINLGMLRHEEDVPPAVRESLAEMSPLVQRAAGLTRQLLLFARRSVMQRRVLDLDLLIEDLLKMLVRLIGESISLRYQSSQESLWVDADPGMIEQAITNLVVNARDAMPAGGQIELSARRAAVDAAHVAAHPQARSGAFVCLTVSDTGCGMDEATLRRIFEPFFTTKAAGKGTGLGLATVQGVVEQHAGWVEVESAVGHGSTFRVYLPAAEPPPGQNAPAAVAQPVPGGSETILLVEDEEMVRRSTTTMLQRHGYRVLEARHGEEALDLWQTHSGEVDLLLTDVVMSQGLDGFVLSEHLRRTNPRLRVVLMSGYSTEALSRDSESAPGTRFLQKPFAPLELLRTLRTLLDDRAMAS
jgi:CheY-like chemotaxis protein